MAGLLHVGEMSALALHVLVELAVLREDDPEGKKTVQELAEKLQASVHTLQKVARRLTQLGFIEGTRGMNGGLKLVSEPESITLLQVIEGMEGTLCSNNCLFTKRVCDKNKRCLFEGVTGGMEKMVREYFTQTTIAELAAVEKK